MDNGKKITKLSNPQLENIEEEGVARYAKASYFREKDKRAAEFLKKHPIPAKFLK